MLTNLSISFKFQSNLATFLIFYGNGRSRDFTLVQCSFFPSLYYYLFMLCIIFTGFSQPKGVSGGPRPPVFGQYGSAGDQLQAMNRRSVPIPQTRNSLFESLSAQLSEGLGEYYTAKVLRGLVLQVAWSEFEDYQHLVPGNQSLLERIEDIRDDNTWSEDLADVILTILQKALHVKIVIVRSDLAPLHYPNDRASINDKTIVIVQNDLHKYYDATEVNRPAAARHYVGSGFGRI